MYHYAKMALLMANASDATSDIVYVVAVLLFFFYPRNVVTLLHEKQFPYTVVSLKILQKQLACVD